jgi:Domain of unknown function (DUF1707)
VVLDVLAEGYADGRLDKEEYDDRAERTARAKTLGELPDLIADLVPVSWVRPPDELHRQAVEAWRRQRRRALAGLLGGASLICWVIWIATSFSDGGFHPYFPWPIFVMLGTGANLGRVLANKQDMIAEEQRRLERKEREALEARRRRT